MARPSKHNEAGSGRAGRLAAGRRPRSRPVEQPSKSAPKEKKPRAPPVVRAFKLVMLLAFMAVLGFAVVLVGDVGVSLLGNVRFGQVTFGDLFGKFSDRVLDRDLPQAKPLRPQPKTPTTTGPQEPTTTKRARAPLPAPRPEDYARHTADADDPQVQAARARLDQLLQF